ncbi:LicD family protein [Aerococcaceae bacterium zg-BR22]|uniref:LicD family protein n=1 Tax=Aerococcaceae bacterium zg-1292 TaxID=2774330 RepID=UPI0040636998|nr:LicD family protein [Aerococcaceae bacterium zg-BR22]
MVTNKISLKEIQQIELTLLQKFINICDYQNINYSLGGGSLLGCIRHGGFIPWDDDIDIMMMRSDYEKFHEYCMNNDTEFDYYSFQSNPDYYKFFSKISDKTTFIIDDIVKTPKKMGVSIDIFPIDNLGNTKEDAVNFMKKTMILRELINASSWKKYRKSSTKGLIYEPIRLAFFILSRLISSQKLMSKVENINTLYKNVNTNYAGCIYGVYRNREIMSKEVFSDYIIKKFENTNVKIIKRYDEYLTSLYGDYMQLPPKDKQVTHHTYEAFKESDK